MKVNIDRQRNTNEEFMNFYGPNFEQINNLDNFSTDILRKMISFHHKKQTIYDCHHDIHN